MHFIEHIIEPTRILLAWQSLDENHRTRYIVAELKQVNEQINLNYLVDTSDFNKAKTRGFESYPAFQDIHKTHHNVLDAFMRRLPPRTRGDFEQYLEGIRLKPNVTLSPFALLGYSGARLPSDGFSLIHPFNNVSGECELLIEAAGYRHVRHQHTEEVIVNTPVSFSTEFHKDTQEDAIVITAAGQKIGYVNRGLLPTFHEWINTGRISNAWVEKINGTPGRPMAYIYVKICPPRFSKP